MFSKSNSLVKSMRLSRFTPKEKKPSAVTARRRRKKAGDQAGDWEVDLNKWTTDFALSRVYRLSNYMSPIVGSLRKISAAVPIGHDFVCLYRTLESFCCPSGGKFPVSDQGLNRNNTHAHMHTHTHSCHCQIRQFKNCEHVVCCDSAN